MLHDVGKRNVYLFGGCDENEWTSVTIPGRESGTFEFHVRDAVSI
jgi:hypothetical protein